MIKRTLKLIFYAGYIAAGSIIAYFLPEHSRYLFGFTISALASWGWKVINTKSPLNQNENEHAQN